MRIWGKSRLMNIAEYQINKCIVQINKEISIDNFQTWDDKTWGMIIHEFFHAYQNFGTLLGKVLFIDMCNKIADIATCGQDTITIPFVSNNTDIATENDLANIRFNQTQTWDDCKRINENYEFTFRKCNAVDEFCINATSHQYLRPHYFYELTISAFGNEKSVVVDGYIIWEGMATMVEQKAYNAAYLKNEMPYDLVRICAKKICPDIEWTPDSLIFICDRCLDYLDSGTAYLDLLFNLQNSKITGAITPKIIVSFLPDKMIDKTGECMFTREYVKRIDKTLHEVIKNMIVSPLYHDSIAWIEDGIAVFNTIRNARMYMELCADKFFPFSSEMLLQYLSLGYPIFRKRNEEYFYFFPRYEAEMSLHKEHWEFWSGLVDFFRLLTDRNQNNTKCPYFNLCENGNIEQCGSRPFSHYQHENCRFQHYMETFNLTSKKIILRPNLGQEESKRYE